MSMLSTSRIHTPSHRSIPGGTAYDLAAQLGKEVVLRTADGIRIELDLKDASIGRSDTIKGAYADIRFMDVTRRRLETTCQRYFTIWERIDDLERKGLRWKIDTCVANKHHNHNEFIVAMAIFDPR